MRTMTISEGDVLTLTLKMETKWRWLRKLLPTYIQTSTMTVVSGTATVVESSIERRFV